MKKIQTTVYRLPCAGFAEKDGTFDQLRALAAVEERRAAAAGRGAAGSGHRGADLPQGAGALPEGGRQVPRSDPEPHLALHRSAASVARRRSPRRSTARRSPTSRSETEQQIKAGQQLPGFAWLKDDGTTACGNWIYCGSWTEAGNQMARRGTEDPSGLGIYPNWAWSWPANRRVLYNRASCDPAGKPWDPERRQVWWNEGGAEVGRQRRARLQGRLPSEGSHGSVHHESRRASGGSSRRSRRSPTGRSRSTTSRSRARSRIRSIRSSRTTRWSRNSTPRLDKYGKPGGELQHRLHDLPADRALPLLDEEQSDERAAHPRAVRRDSGRAGGRAGHQGRREGQGDRARAAYYVAKAFVTRRIKPMKIDGKKIYQIGIPIHWGYRGIAEDAGQERADARSTGCRRPSSIRTPTRPSSRASWSSSRRRRGTAMSQANSGNPQRSRAMPAPSPAPASSASTRSPSCIDATTCIGCKACEVACVEWNGLPFQRDHLRQHLPDDAGDGVELLEPDQVQRARARRTAR